MRRAAVIATVAGALLGAPAAAPAAAIDLMVVGKERVLQSPREVTLKTRTEKVGGRRCRIGGATPLAALLGTRLRVGLRDYGSCGRATRDAGGLFVRRVGAEANRGRDGWVYKVGRRAGTAPAGDPSGPFGSGRLRDGQRVLWFWCLLGEQDSCQRTLEVAPATKTVAPGGSLRVTVRGYDDSGRGVAVEGDTVTLGTSSATTDASGAATLTAPATAGDARLGAEREGMVRAFPREVTVR